MVWAIQIIKGGSRFVHIAKELHAALAITCIFLRNGIVVDQIVGPDGVKVGPEAIQELCGSDDVASARWRRARLKFLSR